MHSVFDHAVVRFSTDAFPARDRFDGWRELFALKLARVDPATPDRSRFEGAATARQLLRTTIVSTVQSAVRLERRRDLLRDGNDDLSFMTCTGRGIAIRVGDAGREVGPGQSTLLHHDLAGHLGSKGGLSAVALRISRAHLRELVGTADLPVMPVFTDRQPAHQLLRLYLTNLAADRGGLAPEAAAIAEQHLCELLASLLDPAAEIVREQRFGGLRAARLQAIAQDIDRNLSDPGLSAAAVGARLGLSERYVQHLVAESGDSFSLLVRRMRLDRARQLLEAPAPQPSRIAEVAYQVGFGDLSNFNRAFRQQHGCTPSDLRRRSNGDRPTG